jgi:hypothetical protein
VNLSYRPALKRLAPATVLLVAAGGLTAAGLAASQASAAAPTPALQLVTPVATQTIERGKGENAYLYGLGVYVVAQKAAVEIRTQRTDYTKPIDATLSVGEGATATKTALPSSLFSHVDTIDNFFTLGVTDSAGKLVKKTSIPFCPNDYSAARAYPDGAATSPYPYQCGSHPFAIGGVFGIQRGWSVSALNSWDNPASFKGKDGTYTVQLLINKPWRDTLKMTKAQSTGTIKVKVKSVDYGDKGATPVSAASSMPAMAGMSMPAANGKLSPQMAILEAARVRALGHASKPAASAPTGKLSAKAVEADTPKPDLRALPAYQIDLERKVVKGKPTKTTYINFGATVWNAGPSPLVVDGFRRPGTALMDAYQYFFDNNGNEVGSAPAGTLQWDPRVGHQHWHFTAFATYRLLDSTQKTALISGKEAFCLAATDGINLNVENADMRPDSTDLATACGEEGALSVREVLATGWGDTYSQARPGQSFDITKVPNGTYYIEVLANPDNKLAEGSTTNNRALRKIKLGGKVGGKRTIKVYDYKGIKAP